MINDLYYSLIFVQSQNWVTIIYFQQNDIFINRLLKLLFDSFLDQRSINKKHKNESKKIVFERIFKQ